MDKWFYLTRETRFRLIVATIILGYLLPWWISSLLLMALAGILALFYKKQINFTERRLIEDNIILCPVTGNLKEIIQTDDKTILSIRVTPFSDYGIYMPFHGEVESSSESGEKFEWQLALKSEKIQFTRLNIKKSFLPSSVLVGPGDIASAGANIGYVRLGADVQVELPSSCEILVKKGDKLRSSQTILASI